MNGSKKLWGDFMPSSYAHDRLGRLSLPAFPTEVRDRLQHFRRMYDMGLQGPDFFFYYDPLRKTAVGQLGALYHEKSGREFFAGACAAVQTGAARAYLCGLLGHYVLDSGCHEYVNRLDAEGRARHIALESEFDRALMAEDGVKTPCATSISGKLRLSREECAAVAAIFPPATGGDVYQSVGNMRFFLNFLVSGNHARKEKLLWMVNPRLPDSMVPAAPVPQYAVMVAELGRRFDRCLARYPRMLAALLAYMDRGEPLGEDFARNFEGVVPEET